MTGSMTDRLHPLMDKLGLAGTIALATLLTIVISLTVTLTVMNLSGVQGSVGFLIKLGILFPLLTAPPVTYLFLKIIGLLDEAQASLQQGEEHIKVLGRLVPVCSCCNKIRDDEAYWDDLDEYRTLSSLEFAHHGTCPECKEKNYEAFLREQHRP